MLTAGSGEGRAAEGINLGDIEAFVEFVELRIAESQLRRKAIRATEMRQGKTTRVAYSAITEVFRGVPAEPSDLLSATFRWRASVLMPEAGLATGLGEKEHYCDFRSLVARQKSAFSPQSSAPSNRSSNC